MTTARTFRLLAHSVWSTLLFTFCPSGHTYVWHSFFLNWHSSFMLISPFALWHTYVWCQRLSELALLSGSPVAHFSLGHFNISPGISVCSISYVHIDIIIPLFISLWYCTGALGLGVSASPSQGAVRLIHKLRRLLRHCSRLGWLIHVGSSCYSLLMLLSGLEYI